jgi:mannose-6-phosphate isomerase-like protein (cupin superfamily)
MTAYDLAELLTARAQSGSAWLPFLEVPSLSMGVYVAAEDDRESHAPHPDDEVYYVVCGRGTIWVEGETRNLGPGSVVYVAAGRQHHFQDIQEELTLLVFFARVAEGQA